MDINRLHYFITVVQAGSLSRASELLHISQPALSKAIKTLEAEVDSKLIIASGRGIAITDTGHKLALKAEPLVDKIFALKSIGAEASQRDSLSVASFEVFSTYFIGKLIAEEFFDYEVRVHELVPGPMEEAVASGVADIGITYLPIPRPELDFLKVKSVEMGIYGLKEKFVGDPVDYPFVAPSTTVSGTPSKVKGLDGWPDHEVPRSIKYHVAMMETALELCRQGQCVGYFPKFLMALHNEKLQAKYRLIEYQVPKKLKSTKQDVYMIKRKSDVESRHFKKISRALRKIKC